MAYRLVRTLVYKRGVGIRVRACFLAQVVGATGSSIVSYLLPGLCYFRLRQGHHPLRYAALGMFVLGLCIMALSISRIIGKAVAPSQ